MKNFGTIYKKIYHVISLFTNEIKRHCVPAYAAQAAFFIMLSAFPFFMFLLTMIQYLPITEQDLIQAIEQGLPAAIAPFLTSIISEIYQSSTTTVISITALSTLWAASKSFYALNYGLNSVYDTPERHNYLFIRIRASIHTVIFTVLLLATLLLLVFGNSIVKAIQHQFPNLEDMALLVISMRASTSMCILILFFLYLYVAVPNCKNSILTALPGAIASSVGWIGFSYLYSFYIDHMSNFTNTYGSLTAIVLLMLWLYFCMYLLLLGGEINRIVQDRESWLYAFSHPDLSLSACHIATKKDSNATEQSDDAD